MRRAAHAVCAALLAGAIGPAAIATTVVSPSGKHVPANLLRIELQLDAPRSERIDLRHVRLRRQGAEIEDAFLGLSLPSRDGRTLTVLLHPGRIKTGVGPNLALGPALREGDQVTLEIDDPPLRKTWTVTAAQRRRIIVADWRVAPPPAAGSREQLRVTHGGVFDQSAADLIAVADAAGRRVEGRVQLSADGAQWLFLPSLPWRPGQFTLRIHPTLEDAAGNRQCAPFEQQDLSAVDCRSEGSKPFRVEGR